MELALIQGAAEAFLKTNEPEYSNIHTSKAQEIIKGTVLASRFNFSSIHSLHSEVTEEQYNRLMNFPFLTSEMELEEFTQWIRSLKKKKVQDWWNHKLQPYILSGIMRFRSRM
ncbi:hypothetical protein BT96DRAFT_992466 [Gymnopus androsaceus JB14]|uniref:Uncharacterized protein n=1 Tax=Gymnopus androsaceus JB14 TaxID=1447944 RepID=A0A6A4HW11_9AGAR|nr:hypothetical protein BT96DRAFT_992466 [Gymnopus androsaceus JB14]